MPCCNEKYEDNKATSADTTSAKTPMVDWTTCKDFLDRVAVATSRGTLKAMRKAEVLSNKLVWKLQ